jgi:putative membrane protein
VAKLQPKDFAAVHAAVTEVEKKTRAEIVPLVIKDAGQYGWVRDRATVVGIVLAILAGEFWSNLRTWPLSGREVLGFVIGGALFGVAVGSVHPFVRFLAGKLHITLEVHRRAMAEFTKRGCGNTREETGILVMVSLFERRIEVIADRGIQKIALEKEGPEVWDKITAEFSIAAGRGQAVEGLIGVIHRLGTMLEKHFPPDGIAGGELPDDLQVED